MVERKVMTVEEMGQALGISRLKAYEFIHAENGPTAVKIGRIYRIPVDGFNEWLARQSVRNE